MISFFSPPLNPRKIAMKARKQGFTLVELSIVLVIIGLLVGGILVGQDLIRAAAERAQISQIERFNSAANTFYEKYGFLPGDINQQAASQFGFAPRGTGPGQGDGNGFIGYWMNDTHVIYAGEALMFWVDLSAAHLIEGSFTAASSTNNAYNTTVTGAMFDTLFPPASIGNGNYVFMWPGDGFVQCSTCDYFQILAPNSWPEYSEIASSPGLTVKQAYDIDMKIDDGYPLTGNVNTDQNYNPPSYSYSPSITGTAATCFDNNSGTTTMHYSITQKGGQGVNCQLYMKLKAGDH